MPTYEYVCKSCGYTFEKFQKMSDPLIKKCPKCEGVIKRLIGTGTGVIIKGPGVQALDNRKESSSPGTCCGRAERCEKPPCSDDGVCKR